MCRPSFMSRAQLDMWYDSCSMHTHENIVIFIIFTFDLLKMCYLVVFFQPFLYIHFELAQIQGNSFFMPSSLWYGFIAHNYT